MMYSTKHLLPHNTKIRKQKTKLNNMLLLNFVVSQTGFWFIYLSFLTFKVGGV